MRHPGIGDRWVGVWTLAVLVGVGAAGSVSAQQALHVPGVVFRAQERAAQSGVDGPRHPAPALEAGAILVLGEMPPLPRDPEDGVIGRPLQVGVHRAVRTPAIEGGSLEWTDAIDTGRVALVGLRSSGAEGLRAAVSFSSMPAGAEVRFYAPEEPGAPEVFRAAELESSTARSPGQPADVGPFWSPVVRGSSMLMEIWLPQRASPAEVTLAVEAVAHLYREVLADKELSGVGASGACNRDIACDPRWQTSGDSVAKYIVSAGPGSFLCTGQLLTDVEQSFTPYFLTAAHCVSTRRVARSMTFFWFFQRAECAGEDPTEVVQTNAGARLLVTTGPIGEGFLSTDHSLVRLKRPRTLPDGVAFSGWSTRPADRLERRRVEAIHHPSGDVKMGSRGKGQGLVQVDEFAQVTDTVPHTHYQLVWRKGTTEGGSSGSGIWFGRRWPNQYLMGVLTGGFASCTAPKEPDFYGRFDKTFAEKGRLRKLLTGKRRQ